ncbi:hypothetical protein F4782DRAFT_9778 [Xylaria castorea]|nr:hypothetical protein F4782DRAFT_9778 [Xylaria castorea]
MMEALKRIVILLGLATVNVPGGGAMSASATISMSYGRSTSRKSRYMFSDGEYAANDENSTSLNDRFPGRNLPYHICLGRSRLLSLRPLIKAFIQGHHRHLSFDVGSSVRFQLAPYLNVLKLESRLKCTSAGLHAG